MTSAPRIEDRHGELHIAADHASFAGHFPGFPILPGVVLLDEALHEIARTRNMDLTHWQVTAVKFLDRVRPGDTLALDHSSPNEATIRFAFRRGSTLVLSGTLAAPPATPSEPARGV